MSKREEDEVDKIREAILRERKRARSTYRIRLVSTSFR